jgi:23S rRNA pseudoU1915 N3-methylase RlmH
MSDGSADEIKEKGHKCLFISLSTFALSHTFLRLLILEYFVD